MRQPLVKKKPGISFSFVYICYYVVFINILIYFLNHNFLIVFDILNSVENKSGIKTAEKETNKNENCMVIDENMNINSNVSILKSNLTNQGDSNAKKKKRIAPIILN